MFILIIGGSEILAILVMILACIAGAVEVVGQILPLLSVLFIIKSIVQDILYGFFAYSARTAHPFQRNGAPFRFKLSKAQQVD